MDQRPMMDSESQQDQNWVQERKVWITMKWRSRIEPEGQRKWAQALRGASRVNGVFREYPPWLYNLGSEVVAEVGGPTVA